jgi:mannonate dehydratase
MAQWWHPVEHLRKRMIMGAAGVPTNAATVDNTYVTRLAQLASQFPAGARWMLFAFDDALDDAGQVRNGWTTFHVPNAHAQVVARQHPDRFEWVASIHPYRADALQRLDAAIAGGARAVKWLPSAMNIDLRDARCQPFYARLAASGLPLIVHCGEEKAVPGAGRDDLGNPLLVRAPLAQGVRVIVAHCASLGDALDLDQRRPTLRPAFALFARVMDEADGRARLLGDVSAVFQSNRSAEVAQSVMARANGDWRGRLLHGSDYPLPGVGWLYRLGGLVRAGLLDERSAQWLPTLQPQNPLMFDLALKRSLRWQGQGLPEDVFATRTHWARSTAPTTTLTAGLS